jgi:hypothetical protein
MGNDEKETELQTRLINAAKAASMLYGYVCAELDADHPAVPGWAQQNPHAVAACMAAAVQIDNTEVLQLAHGLIERLK